MMRLRTAGLFDDDDLGLLLRPHDTIGGGGAPALPSLGALEAVAQRRPSPYRDDADADAATDDDDDGGGGEGGARDVMSATAFAQLALARPPPLQRRAPSGA